MHRPTLLIAAAMPTDRAPIRSTLEIRVIKEAASRNRRVRLDVVESTSVDGLRRALLRVSPQIVHVIAHGSEDALILEDEGGLSQIVEHDALAALLLAHHPPLETVVIGACFSAALARRLALGGIRAVGLRGVGRAAAVIEFSRGLHDALAAKRTFSFAVEEGLRTVALHGHVLSVELHVPELDDGKHL